MTLDRPFPPEEMAARLVRVRRAMVEDGIDALVVLAPDSQYWLCGLESFISGVLSQALIVPADASRQMVLRMVVGEGLLLVGVGLVVGSIASVGATRVLSSYLFDTTPTDPMAFAAVVAALVLAGIAACMGPAWRATTVDPMNALRAE